MFAIHYVTIIARSWVRVLTTILFVIMAAYFTPYMAIITEIILGSQRKLRSSTLTPILNHVICTCFFNTAVMFIMFENRVLRRVFGSKRDEVRGEWRKLHNEELSDLYSLPNIARVVKSRGMRWAGHVARMGEGRGVHRGSGGET